jgi:hypothetical protein
VKKQVGVKQITSFEIDEKGIRDNGTRMKNLIRALKAAISERIPPPPSKPFRIKLALSATYKGPEDKSVDIDTWIFQVSEYLLVCSLEKLQEAPFAARPYSLVKLSLGTNNNGCISRKHSPPSETSPTA